MRAVCGPQTAKVFNTVDSSLVVPLLYFFALSGDFALCINISFHPPSWNSADICEYQRRYMRTIVFPVFSPPQTVKLRLFSYSYSAKTAITCAAFLDGKTCSSMGTKTSSLM